MTFRSDLDEIWTKPENSVTGGYALKASPPLERDLSNDPIGPFGSTILSKLNCTARARYLTFRAKEGPDSIQGSRIQ